MRPIALLAVLGACQGAPKLQPATLDTAGTDAPPDTDAPPAVVSARVGVPPKLPYDGALLGARSLTVDASVPVSVTLLLEGDGTARTIAFGAVAASQTLPILGMRLGKDYSVVVTATDADGRATTLPPLNLPADPLPEDWPIIDVLANDPSRVQRGWMVFDLHMTDATTHLVALDPDLQPAYVWSTVRDLQDTDLVGDGTLLTRMDATAWQIDLLGGVVHQWGNRDLDPEHHLPTATNELHHEVVWLGDGSFATLSSRTLDVPAYPSNYSEPTSSGGPAVIRDSSFARIDVETGAVLEQWFMGDLLDTARIGFDSLDISSNKYSGDAFDWSHANAIAVDRDGGYLVSNRHQDAIVKLSATGELQWILGDHAGWRDVWQPYLLHPVGQDFVWPYHSHGVRVDPANGQVLVFDNHNHGTTPYVNLAKDEDDSVSRVAAFEVDPVEMTVSLVRSFQETSTGTLFSAIMGSAVNLPNGNMLGDFAAVEIEAGVPNADRGWGDQHARFVEWSDEKRESPVLDLRLRSDRDAAKKGWTSYRVQKVDTLYPTSGPWRATETWLP